jgi:3-phenylpropionate/cinnamic acid dioxygenase small subunit
VSAVTLDELMALDELQAAYVVALDGKDMRGWLATFADREDASYICISRENVEQGHELAMMLDDSHGRLHDRVTYITEIWAGTFQDYRTRHVVQRLQTRRGDNGTLTMQSNFSVFFAGDDTGMAHVLTTGVYEDVVIAEAGVMRFLSRRAVLDTAVLPRYLVFPV